MAAAALGKKKKAEYSPASTCIPCPQVLPKKGNSTCGAWLLMPKGGLQHGVRVQCPSKDHPKSSVFFYCLGCKQLFQVSQANWDWTDHCWGICAQDKSTVEKATYIFRQRVNYSLQNNQILNMAGVPRSIINNVPDARKMYEEYLAQKTISNKKGCGGGPAPGHTTPTNLAPVMETPSTSTPALAAPATMSFTTGHALEDSSVTNFLTLLAATTATSPYRAVAKGVSTRVDGCSTAPPFVDESLGNKGPCCQY